MQTQLRLIRAARTPMNFPQVEVMNEHETSNKKITNVKGTKHTKSTSYDYGFKFCPNSSVLPILF
ncbi:hypothetical protein AXF42_Ash011745 [Apostasia shenzhenica]|uniref:Uncharacterized protein n=1 Tax=Apostasia shenzhenica TaxID=1088818 RepID=A0A2H9ZUU2_9ASPA|nr:hypothetical protein AXF42_Ash011745 [Apostasia shenzhenica]